MATEGGDDLKLLSLDQVHRRADIVDRTHLHHDVIETLWRKGRYEREGMMPRVAMHERHRHLHTSVEFHFDRVTNPEPEPVQVEAQTLLDIRHRHHDMPQPLLAGYESGDRARRMEGLFELDRRTVKHLGGKTAGIDQPKQFGDATNLRFFRSARSNFNADAAETLGDFPQSGCIRYFPSGVCDVIGLIAMERQTIRVLIHA
jgi:hypothetical protein